MMEDERILVDELRALAAAEPREAPTWVEERLVDAFRFRVRAARRRKIVAWTGAGVAAAAVAAFVGILAGGPATSAKPEPVRVAPAELPTLRKQVIPAVTPAPAPSRQRVKESAAPTEIATSFYDLPEAEGLAPAEDTSVIRVEVPRTALRLVGLPVSEERADERIMADLVVGQDGLARAVRFVQ
jgi:hypothetical protein